MSSGKWRPSCLGLNVLTYDMECLTRDCWRSLLTAPVCLCSCVWISDLQNVYVYMYDIVNIVIHIVDGPKRLV